jgi:dihydropyrimidinase
VTVTAIVGGTVVTPDLTTTADLLVRDGTIAAIGRRRDGWVRADREIDASGCYVLPGGVDPHCHLMAAPDQATAAAARGGTTTVLSFTNPARGEGAAECLLRSRGELELGGAVVDVGLHAAIYNPEQVTDADLAAVRNAGAGSVKVFLAYAELGIMCSTKAMFAIMSGAAKAGLLVQVHCENGPLIEAMEAKVLADEAHSAAWVFTDTRPADVEEEAVARVLATARLAGAACYLVHLSSAGAIDQVRLARSRHGQAALAEACTHHLLLDDSRYGAADWQRYLVMPPLRPRHHVEALWAAIDDGTIDTVGSDHCQVKTRTAGQVAAADHDVAYGLAGVGPRYPLLLSAAVGRGLPLSTVARLAAESPARAFGHYPRKGALLQGSDADIVIFNPDREMTLPRDGFGDGTGDSVYAGMRVRGMIREVLLRGRTIVSDDAAVDRAPGGRYLRSAAIGGRVAPTLEER